MNQVRDELRKNFAFFQRKVFREAHPGTDFRNYPYIAFLCDNLAALARSEVLRLAISMPPRHLKTEIGSKAFVAWMLGHNPSLQIMLVTGSEALAKDIAFAIRETVQADWYRNIFPTRLRKNWAGLFDFATTAGGSFFSTPIGGNFTGRGADLIIVDDPIDIADAGNEKVERYVRTIFDTKILSRLNNPKTGRVLVISQRLSLHDLCGHLSNNEDWTMVSLPLVAPRSKTYKSQSGVWHRQKGDQLQEGMRTAKQIRQLRENCECPDFETIYQQNPGPALPKPISARHFQTFDPKSVKDLAVVLSVDAGQEAGLGKSFSVVQAWGHQGHAHYLIDQFRDRVDFDDLWGACRSFRLKYRAQAILVERAALGIPLITRAEDRGWKGLRPIIVGGKSKQARLLPHIKNIRRGAIWLPSDAPWVSEFIEEFTKFPDASFSDQVDAATQYLTFMDGRSPFSPPPPRAIACIAKKPSNW